MDLVSAICISHPSRYALLQRAIINFSQQTYEERELLVVLSDDGYADVIRSFLRDRRLKLAGVDKIRVLVYRIRSLMEAFIQAMAWAQGNLIACWDDDNQSHPTRLDVQAEVVGVGRASVVSECFYQFYDSNELYVVDFMQPSGRQSDRCAAASLMFHRSMLPAVDLHVRDSWAAKIIDMTAGSGLCDYVTGLPELFMVGSLGDNLRGGEYHRGHTHLPGTWTSDKCNAHAEQIESHLKAYSFNSSEIDLAGKDAAACKIDELSQWPTWLAEVSLPEDWQYRIPNRDTDELRRAAAPTRPARSSPSETDAPAS